MCNIHNPIFEKKAKKFASFFSKREPNDMSFISYNYCMKKGHAYNNCNTRKYDVPKGFMMKEKRSGVYASQ